MDTAPLLFWPDLKDEAAGVEVMVPMGPVTTETRLINAVTVSVFKGYQRLSFR